MCAFWIDDGTGIGYLEQLDDVGGMSRKKYGISGEGELDWTLSMKVKKKFSSHTVSISPRRHIWYRKYLVGHLERRGSG